MTRLWPVTEEDLIRRAIEKRERWRWRFFWAGFVLFVLAMLAWAWLLVAGKFYRDGNPTPPAVNRKGKRGWAAAHNHTGQHAGRATRRPAWYARLLSLFCRD